MSLEGHLARALQDGCRVQSMTLVHRPVGSLLLPTAQLVACDPLVIPEMEPFSFPMPQGQFPVILSIAQMAEDQRVAFATIRFNQTAPVVWDMLTIEGQDDSKLKEDEFFGYPVDSGTGCFMDREAGRILDGRMREQSDYYETLIAEMEKTYQHTWSWLNIDFDDVNLVAFSSGYGDGAYPTYLGYSPDGEVAAVVTDFAVIEQEPNEDQ